MPYDKVMEWLVTSLGNVKTSSNNETSLLISYFLGFIVKKTPFSEANLFSVDIALKRLNIYRKTLSR